MSKEELEKFYSSTHPRRKQVSSPLEDEITMNFCDKWPEMLNTKDQINVYLKHDILLCRFTLLHYTQKLGYFTIL